MSGKKKKNRNGGQPQSGPAQNAAPAPDVAADEAPKHTVGKTLRRAREGMKLTLEDVSSGINVRVAQLQSIEDDRIDQLPGMTYAVGFVRTYAQFVKLDAKEMVATFKAEHAGEEAAKTSLNFTDPISEDKLPGPMLIGAAAFGIVVLVLGWSLMSSDDEGIELADNIPPAPVVGTASGQPTLADSRPLSGYDTGVIQSADSSAAAAGEAATTTTTTTTAPAGNDNAAPTVATSAADVPAAAPADTGMVVRPMPAQRPVAVAPVPDIPPQMITVKRGKTRVVLEANQKSWVQVSDASGKTVYKKVMAAGEQFFVPDLPGMTMVTSNAGGLNILVDGAPVAGFGKPGEIVRGIQLDADDLKKRKSRVRN